MGYWEYYQQISTPGGHCVALCVRRTLHLHRNQRKRNRDGHPYHTRYHTSSMKRLPFCRELLEQLRDIPTLHERSRIQAFEAMLAIVYLL